MLINNIAASNFGASLSEKLITPAGVTASTQEGITTALDSTSKRIYLKILFENNTRDLIDKEISNFSTHVSKDFILQVPNKQTYFKCKPAPLQVQETGFNSMLYATGEFECIEYEAEKTIISSQQSFSFEVAGNTKSPAIIELTPKADVNSLTITGLGEDMTLRNLKMNKTTIVNTDTGKVTTDGANTYEKFDSWSFPTVSAGTNTVNINVLGIAITIKYKARWK